MKYVHTIHGLSLLGALCSELIPRLIMKAEGVRARRKVARRGKNACLGTRIAILDFWLKGIEVVNGQSRKPTMTEFGLSFNNVRRRSAYG
jgi:hypothetical protein